MIYSDDMLSAYLDNELPEADRLGIERALKADEELRKRVDNLKAVDGLFGRGLDALAGDTIPPEILDLLDSPAPSSSSDQGSKRRWLYPMAACFAVVIAGSIGFGLGSNPSSNEPNPHLFASKISPPNELFAVLESSPSAVPVTLGKDDPAKVEVLLSFATQDGQICRQYSITKDGSAFDALACRQANEWQLIALGLSATQDPNVYQTASTAASAAVEAAVDELIDTGPFSREREADLLKSQWVANRRFD